MNPLDISPSDFDRLIKEIRAGAIVGLALLVMAAARYVFLAQMGPFASVDLNQAIAVVEVLYTGTCAFLVWNFSLTAALLLLFAHVGMVGVWLAVGFGWSVVPGIIFALVLLRSIRGIRIFQLIRRAAAEKLAATVPEPGAESAKD